MNAISFPPFSNRRRLGVAALSLVGLVAAALSLVGLVAAAFTEASAKPAPDSRAQPVYLAYTINNAGYLYTCG